MVTATATDRITVMVADDEETVRDVLEAILSTEPRFELVAVASDAESAIELAAKNHPDVALLDVQMPGGGGPRAAREIARRSPPTRVIALSAHEDIHTVLTMLRAGAKTYVVKSDSTDEILWAIHRTVEGEDTIADDLAFQVASVIAQHNESTKPVSRRRQLQKERIQRVIADRDFTMLFQPVLDLDTGQTVGVEALARFTMPPRRGPDVWLAEAGAVGLQEELELALVCAALDEMAKLPDEVFVAINLSPLTAASDRLEQILDRADAERLVLELTEHAPIDDYDGLRLALEAPRERGVRLAVDDAGAGFASLRHIVRLEPDFIKLDITLTNGIDHDPVRQALAVALVSFAEQIGATVVAEGVETAKQVEALRSTGIRYAQGFHLGIPVPPADLDAAQRSA